ncbi:unnamed protein product [Prorocentrum cordatum]|uniref:Cilia- and flagella-associated protein 157 n=1 Tax=Prorocentrum cordatum TaxID=2364126 RepID=A0ABN9SU28_9DINO|nr:unnamed protein product [Polarella glacialis]
MLEQDGAENEQELRDLDAQHRQEMEDRRADEYRLKKEQDMLLRGLDIKEKERERFLREQAESTDMHAQLRSEAESLQRDVGRLKVEQREREMSLKEKELDIGHYKSKVNTLNKFKMVLASKLREVELSLQPKDDKIEELTAQLRELEAEFENQLNSQKEMEASLKGRKDECDRLRAEGVRLREEAQRKNRAIDRFHDALEKLVCGEQDVRRWPAGIKAIYAEHVDRRHLPPTGGGGTLPTQDGGRAFGSEQESYSK